MTLLELAQLSDDRAEALLSDKEIDAKIARLVRSPDASIAAKGIEIHQKRQAAVEAARPKDKKSADELVEEAVSGKCGLALVAAIWLDTIAEHGPRYNLDALGKTFRELAPNIRRDYPDIFAKMLGELDADCRATSVISISHMRGRKL